MHQFLGKVWLVQEVRHVVSRRRGFLRYLRNGQLGVRIISLSYFGFSARASACIKLGAQPLPLINTNNVHQPRPPRDLCAVCARVPSSLFLPSQDANAMQIQPPPPPVSEHDQPSLHKTIHEKTLHLKPRSPPTLGAALLPLSQIADIKLERL